MRDPCDKAAFARSLCALGAVLGVEPGRAVLAGYWQALVDLELADVLRAIDEAARTTDATYGRLPLPAKIRELAAGDTGALAARAWEAVEAAVRRYGTGRSVDFDDRRINAAVRSLGGWGELGRTPVDKIDWKRREFVAAYRAYCVSPPPAEMRAALPGHYGGEPVAVETGLVAPRLALEEHTEDATPAEVRALVAGIVAGKEG